MKAKNTIIDESIAGIMYAIEKFEKLSATNPNIAGPKPAPIIIITMKVDAILVSLPRPFIPSAKIVG